MTLGHRGIYREVDAATPDAIPALSAFASAPWDTVVAEDTATIEQQGANGTDFKLKEIGHYLVAYNLGTTNNGGGSGVRSQFLTALVLDGVTVPWGRASSYMARGSQSDATHVGVAVLQTTATDRLLHLVAAAVDTNATSIAVRQADTSGIQILKIGDGYDFCRIQRRNVAGIPVSTATFVPLEWDSPSAGDELTAGYQLSSSPRTQVQVLRDGNYLVTASIGVFLHNGDMAHAAMRILRSGTEPPGCRVGVHLDTTSDASIGAMSLAQIISCVAGDTIEIQYAHTQRSLGDFTLTSNSNGLTITHLPDWSDNYRGRRNLTDLRCDTTQAGLPWNEDLEQDTRSFTHSTSTNPDDITSVRSDLIMVVGCAWGERTSTTNSNLIHTAGQPRVNGTLLKWGYGGALNRGKASVTSDNTTHGYTFAALLNATAADVIDIRSLKQALTNADATCLYQADKLAVSLYNWSIAFAPIDIPQSGAPPGLQLAALDARVSGIGVTQTSTPQLRVTAPQATVGIKVFQISTPALTLAALGGFKQPNQGFTPSLGLTALPGTASSVSSLNLDQVGIPRLNLLGLDGDKADPITSLFYTPAIIEGHTAVPIDFVPTVVGDAPTLWQQVSLWHRAIFTPGLPTRTAANAYIEIRHRAGFPGQYEYEVFGGPRAGVYNRATIQQSRYGFGNFHVVAEAIFEAGRVVSLGDQTPLWQVAGHPYLVVTVDGDITPMAGVDSANGYDLGRASIGGSNTLAANAAWWSASNDPFPNTTIPRPITGLTILGKHAPVGDPTLPTVRYQDRIGGFGIQEKGGAGIDFAIDDIRYENLDIITTETGGGLHVINGNGIQFNEVRFGRLILKNARIYRPLGVDPIKDAETPPKDVKTAVRMFHTRGCYHFENVVLGDGGGTIFEGEHAQQRTFEEHGLYLDFVNDGRQIAGSNANRFSYFKNVTNRATSGATACSKTFHQLTARANESNASEGPARGVILFDNCWAKDCCWANNSATFTIVGHVSTGQFPEDGTIIYRNCVDQEGEFNRTHPGVGTSFIGKSKSILAWGPFSDWSKSDPDGYDHTRIVIDGLEVKNLEDNGAMPILRDTGQFDIRGCGDFLVYKFKAGNPSSKAVFRFDFAANTPTTALAAGTTNNPPRDSQNEYSTTNRSRGTYFPFTGAIRFILRDPETDAAYSGPVSQYVGWRGGIKVQVRDLMNEGQNSSGQHDLADLQVDKLKATLITLPTGVTLKPAGDVNAGHVSGTPLTPCPNLPSTGTEEHFGQNLTTAAVKYLAAVPTELEVFSISASNAVSLRNARIGLGVSSDPFQLSTPTLTLSCQGSHVVGYRYDQTSTASLALAALDARVSSDDQRTYLTAANLELPQYFQSGIIWKATFRGSRAWQYRQGSTVFAPYDDQGGITVIIDANGYPDMAQAPPGDTVVSQIYSTTLAGQYASDTYILRWSGSNPVGCHFASGAPFGNAVTSVTSSPFEVRAVVDASAGALVVEILSGVVTSMSVITQTQEGTDQNRPVIGNPSGLRLLELIDPGSGVRLLDWTGVNFCGSSDPRKGWTPAVDWPDASDGSANHKHLSDVRQTQNNRGGLSGVSLELAVQLANQFGFSLWWNVPHLYSGPQLAAMARYVDANLDAAIPVIFEYSNEIWNAQFPVNAFLGSLVGGPFGASFGEVAASQWKAMVQVIRNNSPLHPGRVLTALMGNRAQSSFIQSVLDFIPTNNPLLVINVLGCSGYFNNPQAENSYSDLTTTTQILADAEIGIDLFTKPQLEAHRSLLNARSTLQVAGGGPQILFGLYEAGQHISPKPNAGTHSIYLQNWIAAQNDPRMRNAYIHLIGVLALPSIRPDVVAWFTWCSDTQDVNGSWGHLLHLSDVTGRNTSPKWDAIIGQDVVIEQGAPASLTLSGVEGSRVNAELTFFQDAPAVLRFSAPQAGLGLEQRSSAALTLAAFDGHLSTGTNQQSPASLRLAALDALVSPSFQAVSPFNRPYTPPEVTVPATYKTSHGGGDGQAGQPGDPVQVYNVFFSNAVPAPPGGRPVLVHSHTGLYLRSKPKTGIVQGSAEAWLFDLILQGWMVVSIGTTGIETTFGFVTAESHDHMFDGYGTSRWEAFNLYSPEKDMAFVVQALKQSAAALGIRADRIFLSGIGTPAICMLGLLGTPRVFSGATSAQALADALPYAVIARAPIVWWPGVLANFTFGTFGAAHWPSQAGADVFASSIGDVAAGVLAATSPDRHFREAGFRAAQVFVFLAYDELAQTTDLTSDGFGDPSVVNRLDPSVGLQPYWHGLRIWQTMLTQPFRRNVLDRLAAQTAPVDITAGIPGGSPHTDTFTGGISGSACQVLIRDWAIARYNTELEVSTPTLTLTPQAPTLGIGVFQDAPASLQLTAQAGSASSSTGNNFAQLSTPQLTLTALRSTGFGTDQRSTPALSLIAFQASASGGPTQLSTPTLTLTAHFAKVSGVTVIVPHSRLTISSVGFRRLVIESTPRT